VIKKTTRSPEGNQEVCIPQLTPEKSEAMALAVLLGGWNESLTGDMEIVAQLVGQNDS
jgi:hypothetical protein